MFPAYASGNTTGSLFWLMSENSVSVTRAFGRIGSHPLRNPLRNKLMTRSNKAFSKMSFRSRVWASGGTLRKGYEPDCFNGLLHNGLFNNRLFQR